MRIHGNSHLRVLVTKPCGDLGQRDAGVNEHRRMEVTELMGANGVTSVDVTLGDCGCALWPLGVRLDCDPACRVIPVYCELVGCLVGSSNAVSPELFHTALPALHQHSSVVGRASGRTATRAGRPGAGPDRGLIAQRGAAGIGTLASTNVRCSRRR
jgi:hypothetical protein